MMRAVDDAVTPPWVERLCRVAEGFRNGTSSVRQLFVAASPDLADERRVVAMLHNYLADDPAVVEAWQTYSYDKRGIPSPYLDGREVGFFDRDRRDARTYLDQTDACATFIYREAAWALERQRPV
jgi:hypothetical protein